MSKEKTGNKAANPLIPGINILPQHRSLSQRIMEDKKDIRHLIRVGIDLVIGLRNRHVRCMPEFQRDLLQGVQVLDIRPGSSRRKDGALHVVQTCVGGHRDFCRGHWAGILGCGSQHHLIISWSCSLHNDLHGAQHNFPFFGQEREIVLTQGDGQHLVRSGYDGIKEFMPLRREIMFHAEHAHQRLLRQRRRFIF